MFLYQVLDNHTRKLLDQCYLAKAAADADAAPTLCEDQKLELSHIIVSLKILLFKIDKSWQRVVFADGNKKLYKFANYLERLQLKFEGTKGKQHLQVLRRQKILAFCQNLRWSIEEATFLKRTYVQGFKNNNKELYLKKLIKYKQRVFLLVRRCEKDDACWTKKYLSLLKKFKSCADKVSDVIDVHRHQCRRARELESTMENTGIGSRANHSLDLW